MELFKRWNKIVGWAVFAIATLSYLLTIEPTTSLWDCSEFIATSYKLEVGHPPGAPLFMMLARLASLLAPIARVCADDDKCAKCRGEWLLHIVPLLDNHASCPQNNHP